jgi:hypothetical protein
MHAITTGQVTQEMILELDQGRSPIGRLDTFLHEVDPVRFFGLARRTASGAACS